MKRLKITAVTTVICLCAASGARAQRPWRRLQARSAGVSLEAPDGWVLAERELYADTRQQGPIVLVRVSSRAIEDRLSQMADLEIYVHSVPEELPVARWVRAEHADVAGRAGQLREARVAGLPGLARSLTFAGAEPMREVFLVERGRGLHIAWPDRPGLELAVQHALDTLSLSAPTESGDVGGVGKASGLRQSGPYGIVHPVIVAPAGAPTRRDYRLVVTKALQHVQLWYQAQLGGGMTFSLADTAVLNSAQTESWFANNAAGADPAFWFFRNGLDEALGMVGGWFYDAANSWVVYVDADPNCGSITGATSGVVLMPRNDLRGLTQQAFRRCSGDGPDIAAVCRWVGGVGHELGHAFGLPHPPGCVDNDSATPCADTLLWTGYAAYPNTVLTPDEKARLVTSPFFSALNLTRPLFSCAKLFAPPQ